MARARSKPQATESMVIFASLMAASEHFRAHGRRRVDLSATVRGGGSTLSKSAGVVDLSLGGACLTLAEPLALDARVTVEIAAPTLWDPLLLTARVAWVRYGGGTLGARVGVAFEHAAGGALLPLVELLGAHAYGV